MSRYARLARYARPQRRRFLLLVFLTLAASSLVALQPWPLKLLVDHVLGTKPLPAFLEMGFVALAIESDRVAILVVVVLGGLGLFALGSALDAALAWIWTMAGRRLVYDVGGDFFARRRQRPLAVHKPPP